MFVYLFSSLLMCGRGDGLQESALHCRALDVRSFKHRVVSFAYQSRKPAASFSATLTRQTERVFLAPLLARTANLLIRDRDID